MDYRSMNATEERRNYLLNYLQDKTKLGDTFTDGVSTWERVHKRKNNMEAWKERGGE